MTRPHLLLIDDDSAIQEMLYYVFESEGYLLTICNNGQEALELLDTFKPDLILLDLLMPVMNGYTFLEVYPHHCSWHSLPPILVITADVSAAIPLAQRGIEDYLFKPFRIKSLLTAIAQRLS